MAKTVVALYDDASSAHQAVNELVSNGFLREDISLMTPDSQGEYARALQSPDNTAAAQGAGIGAGLGAALGGFGGLLVGLGALTIPGIGPVLAAGPLAAAMSGLAGAGVGAVAGGVTGGILGALVDMGVPEERANYYAEGVRRGGTLLVVRTEDDRTRDAVDIVNRHRPIDLNERAGQWRESGWSRFDSSAAAYNATRTGSTTSSSERRYTSTEPSRPPLSGHDYGTTGSTLGTSPSYSVGDVEGVYHEQGSTSEYPGMAGSTDEDYKTAAGHNDELVHGNTTNYEGMAGSTGTSDYGTHHSEDLDREQGTTSEYPGMAGSTDENYEDVVGRNEEQVHGNTSEFMGMAGSTASHDYDTSGSSSMGRDYGSGSSYGAAGMSSATDYDTFDRYDTSFRSYFASTPYASTYTYEEFLPAYRYGYDISREDRYRGHNWSDIEADARRNWEMEHPDTWERFKDSIRHAWEEFKDAVS